MSVSVYIRERGTRRYTPANPKQIYPAGTAFVLRYEQHGKRKWKTLPRHVLNVQAAIIKAKLLEVKLLQGAAEPKLVEAERPLLKDAITRFINVSQATKSKDTGERYEHALLEFQKSCIKLYLDQITEDDLEDFEIFMVKGGLADRTVDNRLTILGVFLHRNKIKLSRHRRYTEPKVSAYRPDELRALFAAATPELWLLFQFFLCTGAREMEVVQDNPE